MISTIESRDLYRGVQKPEMFPPTVKDSELMALMTLKNAGPIQAEFALPAWLERVRCPKTMLGGWQASFVSNELEQGLPRFGYLVNERAGTAYNIRDGIMDLTVGMKRGDLTLAGWSNQIPPTPQLYERIWRRRSLTLLTGENFSVEREWKLLRDWTQVQAGEYVVDLGTSTGLYARGLSEQGATIFAVDAAAGMLREAKKYITREKRSGIVLMRATAENLPFEDASADAVVVGGSLNEMKSLSEPLREAYRVTRRGGRMFVMSLSRATKLPGRWVQKLLRPGGIQFPTVNEFNAAAQAAGWKITAQELKGIVLFSLLEK